MEVNQVVSVFVQVFLSYLLPVVASFAAGYAIVLVKKAAERVREDNPELFWTISAVAGMAVKAAEQAKVNDLLIDKKQYAINAAEKMLAAQGYIIDLDVLDAAIEAAVLDKFHPDKVSNSVFIAPTILPGN